MGDGDDFMVVVCGECVEDVLMIGGIGDGVGVDDGDGRIYVYYDVGVVDWLILSVEGFKCNWCEIFGGVVFGDDFFVCVFGKRDVRDAFFVVDYERFCVFEKFWRVLMFVL